MLMETRRIKCFIITNFIILMLITTSGFAANLRYFASFDNQTIPDPSDGYFSLLGPWGSDGWSLCTSGCYTFGEGRGGSGYSFGSGTYQSPRIHWYGLGTWYTDELYVSFYMRYPTFTHNYPNENIKFFYPTFGSNDKVEYVLYGGSDSAFWMHYNNNAAIRSGYLTLHNQADGNWHRYEFWIKFSTGEHKFWYDRPAGNWTDGSYLKINVNYGTGVWDNRINFITVGPSLDAEAASTFTRYMDDIEIWDGMPDGSEKVQDVTAPMSPIGVKMEVMPQ